MKPLTWLLALVKALLLCATTFGAPLQFTTEREEPTTVTAPAYAAVASAPAKEWHGLIVFTAPWCGNCKPYQQTLASMKEQGWGGSHIVIIDYDTHRKYAASMGVTGLPTTVAVNGGKRIASKVGALTRGAVEALWQQSKGVKAASPVKTVSHGGLYYARGVSRYTWPGDLRTHLRSPPHSLSAAAVSRMTDAECIGYHDNWHSRFGER